MSSWGMATRTLPSICTPALRYLKRRQACGLISYRVVIKLHAFSTDIIINGQEALQENAWLGDPWVVCCCVADVIINCSLSGDVDHFRKLGDYAILLSV